MSLNLNEVSSPTLETNHVLRGEKSVICLQMACEMRVHPRWTRTACNRAQENISPTPEKQPLTDGGIQVIW